MSKFEPWQPNHYVYKKPTGGHGAMPLQRCRIDEYPLVIATSNIINDLLLTAKTSRAAEQKAKK
jgi:hypothetical protein